MNWIKVVRCGLFFFGMILLGNSAFATTWHVRSTAACANNGNGTASTCAASSGAAGAWSGLANVGWSSVQPGDTVMLYGGDTYTDSLTVGKDGTGSGTTFTNPITISVENTSSGTNPAIVDQANAPSITSFNNGGHRYIVYDFLYGQAAVADPSGTPNTNYGIQVINIGSGGDCWGDFRSGGPVRIFHLNCSGSSTGGGDMSGGIIMGSGAHEGWEIAYNWIHGTYTGATQSLRWHATAVALFNGGGTSSYTANLIHHNKEEYLYHDGIKCNLDCSIYNNEGRNIEGSGHSDALQCQSGTYCQIYSNYIHDNGDQSIYLDMIGSGPFAHMRIYNNLIVNSSFGSVLHPEQADIDDLVIANNTYYNMGSQVLRKGGACSGTCPHVISNLVILNNIIGTSGGSNKQIDFNDGDVSFLDSNSFDYDVYMTPSSASPQIVNSAPGCAGGCSLAQIRALSPAREANGKVANPSFVNTSTNWRLVTGDTVAGGAGRNLYSIYPYLQKDKDGNPRLSSGTWDVGAYATSSSSGNLQPTAPSGLTAVVN